MRRAGQPPRTFPPNSSGRVSFNCDRQDLDTRRASAPAPCPSYNESTLSSSAPSALPTYRPFAAFSDDDETNPIARRHPLSESSSAKASKDVMKVPQESELRVQQQSSSNTSTLVSRNNDKQAWATASASATTTMTTTAASSTPHARAKPITTAAAISREQRRHSSEDGLVHGTAVGAARSLPLCVQMSKSGQQQAAPDVYTVPPKCRMVFHMRDEVSKYKGPIHGSEEDRTGCGEKASRGAGDGYSPQPQPRRYPPKKSSSNKCTKTVSFREPEPWRECVTAADDIQSTEAATIVVATATVPSYMYSDGVKIMDPLAVVSESEDPPLATLKPAMALSSPLIETNLSASDLYRHRNQQSLSQGSHDLKKTLPTAPGAFPLATTPAQPHHHHHQRNMSAPSVTAFIAPSSSPLPQLGVISRSYSNGQPRAPMASGAKSAKSSNSQISGNRFSRLWKSVAHKYNNNPTHGHEVRMQVSDRPGGMVGPRAELEPLVSVG